jgi:hypothetical protein
MLADVPVVWCPLSAYAASGAVVEPRFTVRTRCIVQVRAIDSVKEYGKRHNGGGRLYGWLQLLW